MMQHTPVPDTSPNHAAAGPPACWIITDGKAGNISPARGLAAALGLPFQLVTITQAQPWRSLPAFLRPACLLGITAASKEAIPAQPPRLIISCGRHAIGPARYFKQQHKDGCYHIHIQHPHCPLRWFDQVIAPAHDQLEGPNVLTNIGSLHPFTPTAISAAAQEFLPQWANLPRPWSVLLIGGANKRFRFDATAVAAILDTITRMQAECGGSLLVSLSRRTGPEQGATLTAGLAPFPHWIWDGQGPNPYAALLGVADQFFITQDSVNMLSEASITGKPIFPLPLPEKTQSWLVRCGLLPAAGHKFDLLLGQLAERNIIQPYRPGMVAKSYIPLAETARIAAQLRARLPDWVLQSDKGG